MLTRSACSWDAGDRAWDVEHALELDQSILLQSQLASLRNAAIDDLDARRLHGGPDERGTASSLMDAASEAIAEQQLLRNHSYLLSQEPSQHVQRYVQEVECASTNIASMASSPQARAGGTVPLSMHEAQFPVAQAPVRWRCMAQRSIVSCT